MELANVMAREVSVGSGSTRLNADPSAIGRKSGKAMWSDVELSSERVLAEALVLQAYTHLVAFL